MDPTTTNPLDMETCMIDGVKRGCHILIPARKIDERVKELAVELAARTGSQSLVLLSAQYQAWLFKSLLAQELEKLGVPIQNESSLLRRQSHGGNDYWELERPDRQLDLAGRRVVLVDAMLTNESILGEVKTRFNADLDCVVVLLEQPRFAQRQLPGDVELLVGFEAVGYGYLFGCGLEYKGYGSQNAFIGWLPPYSE